MKDNLYVVYHVKHKGRVVYIGYGRQGRPNHAISGTSHVYELNRLHHTGEDVKVDVVYSTTNKEDAMELEKQDILNYTPEYNKVYLTKCRQESASKASKLRSKLRKVILHIQREEKYSKASRKATEILELLLDAFSIQQLLSGVDISGFENPPFPQMRRFIAGDKKTSEWYRILLNYGIFEVYRNQRKHCFMKLVYN